MTFSARIPQYFICNTKSQRLLVARHRLSSEKVYLHDTIVTWAWDACGLFGYLLKKGFTEKFNTQKTGMENKMADVWLFWNTNITTLTRGENVLIAEHHG